jgi:hypothetical protein
VRHDGLSPRRGREHHPGAALKTAFQTIASKDSFTANAVASPSAVLNQEGTDVDVPEASRWCPVAGY